MSSRFLQQAFQQRPFTVAAAFLLELVGLVHIIRLFAGWEIVIEGMTVPMWLSGVAAAALMGLAVQVWMELWRRDRVRI